MYGSMRLDIFAFLMRLMLLLGCGMTIALSHRFLMQTTRIVGDFYALVMGATLGGMFLASATDLVLLFVGLETLSITSYILAGYLRRNTFSAEASLKYLVYGGMGTAVFLFGASLLYGLSGSTQFDEIAATLATYQGIFHPMLWLLLLMLIAPMAFKLSLAPFHMWTPDVYEGAPTPVSAFLSVVSKTAAFALIIRVLVLLLASISGWPFLLGILAVISMTLGNVVALKQTSLKRLLAYSTIAHAGYMLLGLVVNTTAGLAGLIFYLMTYLFMNMGAFAAVVGFQTMTGTDRIEALSGLVRSKPFLTLSFSVFLLALAGIPITSGFFAKFFLFQSVAASGPAYMWLVIIALVNSTISLAYYLNVIRLMVVKDPSPEVLAIAKRMPVAWPMQTVMTMALAVTLVMGIFATPFYRMGVLSATQLATQGRIHLSIHP
jgi:NAD(P)H-quinone oxidoreductase subunit 2